MSHISLLRQGWAYLSTIKDLFDGFIVSHQLGRMNSLELVLNTLKQARHNEKVTDGLLLHSDHGAPVYFARLCGPDAELCHQAFHVPARQLLG